ncbi:Uncharacterized protein Fot_22115 [Forsythia ovata]|uniref:Uncharacterized protein n=1 Tax=Forsythia ovata TaxID=205694 RepID=A0ABD1UWT4_9LAMI
MPRVISSSTSQENSSPSSNFSPESSGGVDRPFGVVGRPIGRSQPATSFGAVDRPYRGGRPPLWGRSIAPWEQSTARLGAVDCSLGGSRLPPEEQSVDCSIGGGRLSLGEQSVDCSFWSGRQ